MSANDRLSLDPFGPVEGGNRIVEGSHVADVCPQPTIPHPLDGLTQLGAIGYDDEVDSQAASGPRIGRAGNGHQRSSGANHARGEESAARSTLITQVSRSLVLINALATTGILIPRALNAARMRAAWIASIHAIPASNSTMYGDFNFAASLTYPTAAPISSASASFAMLTSLSTLPSPLPR